MFDEELRDQSMVGDESRTGSHIKLDLRLPWLRRTDVHLQLGLGPLTLDPNWLSS